MAFIKLKQIVETTIQIPKCFCGNEPEVVTKRASGDNCAKILVRIECPYCGAHSINREYNTHSFNDQYNETRAVIEHWCDLIRGGKQC